MAVGSATLPGEMVSNQDGVSLKQQAATGVRVTLQFSLGPAYIDRIAWRPFRRKGQV
jgi:hypothetical protein